ncbi:hypothetical protein [Candidatus Contendibacter odensensis]|uniref:hypothetical protein n=1 Tax=Candidatus Contendibacter odensensis TaxID=1400860 RepID=UPI00054FD569|nr:hypothetical protein [Candidatus Contendobacter odensis]
MITPKPDRPRPDLRCPYTGCASPVIQFKLSADPKQTGFRCRVHGMIAPPVAASAASGFTAKS